MANVITGAQAIIKYEGFPLAFISSINIRHENRLGEIPRLDDLEVAEYPERGHRCSFTITKYKLIPDAASVLNISPDDAADLGLDSIVFKDILTQPETIVEVFLDEKGISIYEMTGVKFEGGSGQVSAGGVWTGQWNFRARRGRGI